MDICESAINSVMHSNIAFCKFLSANDTGLTGGHQCGIYIPKDAAQALFSISCIKGQNEDRSISILWNQHIKTDSRVIYYGSGSRNECRITRFGKGFTYLNAAFTGALLVFVKEPYQYQAFLINTETEIERFLWTYSISPNQTNKIITKDNANIDALKRQLFNQYINSLPSQDFFPSTKELANAAHEIYFQLHNDIISKDNCDKLIIAWLDIEYELFKEIEANSFKQYQGTFNDVDTFINVANTFLNRRKSRAGKSLEHHLSFLFSQLGIPFTSQGTTENNKKPDFIFPSVSAYHNPAFPTNKLIVLAAKTTCKDRWRQILNEADRVRSSIKFLFTLQQGISPQQLNEMSCEKVVLVVPKSYVKAYPKNFRERLLTLQQLIEHIIDLYKDIRIPN